MHISTMQHFVAYIYVKLGNHRTTTTGRSTAEWTITMNPYVMCTVNINLVTSFLKEVYTFSTASYSTIKTPKAKLKITMSLKVAKFVRRFQMWQSYWLDSSLIPNISSCPSYALFLLSIIVAKK